MSDMKQITALDDEGQFAAYISEPDTPPKAAIVVIQEIFGLNTGIRRKCDKLAEAGYLAIAPDLFWRLQPGINLDPDIDAELQQAFGYMQKFDQDAGIRDIEATIGYIRAKVDNRKVGCVGYCLGGRLAYMTAARTDVDVSVGYYGVGIDELLREKHGIANPLLLHIPTADHFVSPETQKKMHAGLDDHSKVTLYDYDGLDHGFATEFGARRDEEGATLADSRTAAFFEEHLG